MATMKFSKRGKTRIKMPATNDTSGESAINIKRELGRFRLSGKQTVSARGIFESSVLPRSTGKRAFAALAYANSATHSLKGALP